MTSASRRYTVVAAILLAITVLCIYFYFNPESGRLFPRCPFLILTGFQCPGCGSQRAIHSLLHGDIASAWHFNAVMLLFIPIVAVLLIAEIKREKWTRFYASVNSRYVIWGIAAILLLWGVLRNIC